MKFTYIIGPPGSGKTTTMRWIRFHLGVTARPINGWLLAWLKAGEPVAIEIGGLKLGFGGTDALSMSIIERADPFVRTNNGGVDKFAEGDRLANDRFFTAIKESGYDFRLFYLATVEAYCEKWRAERAAKLGVNLQDPVWVQSRATKARKLALDWNATSITPALNHPNPAEGMALAILKEISE